MQSDPFWRLVALAAGIGIFHTLTGPDHYVPFVAMSRAGRWSMRKTLTVSALCGMGHVLGSVILGIVGAAFLDEVEVLTGIEASRGRLASWLLVAFGFVYMIWGIRRGLRSRTHTHSHGHADGIVHAHSHHHHSNHLHVHAPGHSERSEESPPHAIGVEMLRFAQHDTHRGPAPGRDSMTPWILFAVFVFGPCEPLIPILMYPALQFGWLEMLLVAGVFAVVTIATMMTMIVLGVLGLRTIRLGRLGRYAHALSGFALLTCGGAMIVGL